MTAVSGEVNNRRPKISSAMALGTHRVIVYRELERSRVWIVAIHARDPRMTHLAVHEGAPNKIFLFSLAIWEVSDRVIVQDKTVVIIETLASLEAAGADLLASRMATRAIFHHNAHLWHLR